MINELPATGDVGTGIEGAAPSRQLLTTFADWRDAVQHVIETARVRLRIFDADGALLDLNDGSRIESLRSVVAADREARIVIVLRTLAHVTQRCPRFVQFLSVMGHQVELREAVDDAARVSDCFIVADETAFARRPVHNQPRGVWVRHDQAELSMMLERHAQVVASSNVVSLATTLGL